MRTRCVAVVILVLGVAVAINPVAPASAQSATTATFASAAEALDFLRHADVVSMERIPLGVTEPRKVLLQRQGMRAYAVFRDVDRSFDRVRLDDGSFHMRLRDSALFEVAAYRLAMLLGFENVPPTVVRTIDDRTGSLQLWVNDAMTERHRRELGAPLPNRDVWLHQMRLMSLFDTLVANVDRNSGNYLIEPSGKLWFIDHTRAFQLSVENWSPRRIAFCDRRIWEHLRAIDRDGLDRLLGDVLEQVEIRKLAERIDKVVAHIDRQIAERGEGEVILQGCGPQECAPDPAPHGEHPPPGATFALTRGGMPAVRGSDRA